MGENVIELLILDVDGVLTNGSVLMTGNGDSAGTTVTLAKAFYVQDGYALKLWQRCGGRVALLSGWAEAAVARRAAELGIEHVHTGIADKLGGYDAILASVGCRDAAVAYVGDDLPDLGPMARCGFPIAVANAAPAVKRAAVYVTRRRGGDGAVAEAVEWLLRSSRRWPQASVEQRGRQG
jgi:3-deoxy-D-manno-octulosonate 8-phosphate phosphatase (KDO 8-P phosphatase)